MILPENVLCIIARLQKAGYDTCLVGGCVRDALRGEPPHDYDLTTNASTEVLHALFADCKVLDTGMKHGTLSLVFRGPKQHTFEVYEITAFRGETLADDLAKRDFTMNAVAYRPETGLFDPFGGQADIAAGIIRCVGDPDARLTEDPLRALRAVRFASRFGFALAEDTRAACARHAAALQNVAPERIGSELCKLLCGRLAAQALAQNPEVLCAVLPELAREGGVWAHTLAALSHAQEDTENLPAAWADETMCLALLLHGLGETHARAVCKRLRLSNALTQDVTQLVTLCDAPLTPSRPAVRRALTQCSKKQLVRLLKLQSCDCLAQTPPPEERLAQLRAFAALLSDMANDPIPHTLAGLAVSGRDLAEIGVPQGPQMAQILAALLGEVMDETLQNRKQPLLDRAKALLGI